jgi:hypothetical protein
MRSPRWLRRSVIVIFQVLAVVYLMALAARLTLDLVDGAFGLEEASNLGFLSLIFFMLMAGRIRAESRQDQNETTAVIERVVDRPTPVIATVHPFPPATTYRASTSPQALRSRRRSVSETDEFAWGLAAMVEDTGGHPPVPGRGEEAAT